MDKQELALFLSELADWIEDRAVGAGRIIRQPGQRPLCQTTDHDDRYCDVCSRMEDGMNLAAQMVREIASSVVTGDEAAAFLAGIAPWLGTQQARA